MQPLCTADEQCLNFFPGMGFRPAVHVVQRDQYGDRMTLVVGDDSPMEGKVPPGYDDYMLLVDPYAMQGGATGPGMAALAQGSSPSGPSGLRTASFWGGGSGSSGSGRVPGPWTEDTSSGTPEGSHPGQPVDPAKPVDPLNPVVPTPEIPVNPPLPPLAPVPLPDAAPMLIASLLALALLRRIRG